MFQSRMHACISILFACKDSGKALNGYFGFDFVISLVIDQPKMDRSKVLEHLGDDKLAIVSNRA